MADLLDKHVDEMLRLASNRLLNAQSVDGIDKVCIGVLNSTGERSKEEFRIRSIDLQRTSDKPKERTAGTSWFNMPKSQISTEFKREWQILRMRGLLDPKHQKKALRADAPEFSQMGEVIAGATDVHNSRLTNKERRRTLLEEATASLDNQKVQTKYARIQRSKVSGKKTFYQGLMAKRRKRQNHRN